MKGLVDAGMDQHLERSKERGLIIQKLSLKALKQQLNGTTNELTNWISPKPNGEATDTEG